MTTKISSEELSKRILEHEYVPKHIILNKEEKEKLLKRYNIAPYQLPKILSSDPIVKIIGAKPGDIIMIIRKSPTGGVTVAYRYVVLDLGEKESKKKKKKAKEESSEEEVLEEEDEEE